MNMKKYEIKKKKIDFLEFKKRSAVESDFNIIINESAIIKDEDIKIVYIDNIEEDMELIFNILESIKYDKGYRTNGVEFTSRIFGFRPKNYMRRTPCKITSLAREFPQQHRILEIMAKIAEKYYKIYNNDKYNYHLNEIKKVLSDYRILDTVFTSGIVNQNNPLQYHFDVGNFNKCWSAMFAFKKDIEGGYLSIPEYDIGIEIKNNSLLLFDGQSLMHGVTPIKKLKNNAKRFTIVYYSLKKMWTCKPIDEEIKNINNNINKNIIKGETENDK
jgi:hypothetical protein